MAGDELCVAEGETCMTGECCRPEGCIYRCVLTYSHLCYYIYGLVALFDNIQPSFSSITISTLNIYQLNVYIYYVDLDHLAPLALTCASLSTLKKSQHKTPKVHCYFIAHPAILLGFQIGDQVVKDYPKLLILHVEHLLIQRQLKNLTEAKDLSTQTLGAGNINSI
jgi:hypothetical protein